MDDEGRFEQALIFCPSRGPLTCCGSHVLVAEGRSWGH